MERNDGGGCKVRIPDGGPEVIPDRIPVRDQERIGQPERHVQVQGRQLQDEGPDEPVEALDIVLSIAQGRQDLRPGLPFRTVREHRHRDLQAQRRADVRRGRFASQLLQQPEGLLVARADIALLGFVQAEMGHGLRGRGRRDGERIFRFGHKIVCRRLFGAGDGKNGQGQEKQSRFHGSFPLESDCIIPPLAESCMEFLTNSAGGSSGRLSCQSSRGGLRSSRAPGSSCRGHGR